MFLVIWREYLYGIEEVGGAGTALEGFGDELAETDEVRLALFASVKVFAVDEGDVGFWHVSYKYR